MSVCHSTRTEDELNGQCRELLRYVAGYRGYRAKEWRRREDKRLRDEISRMLLGGSSRLEAIEKEAFLSGRRGSASALAESRRRLGEISQTMRSVSCGKTKFFEDDIVSAARLRDAQEADLELFRIADSIVRCVSKLEQSDLPPDEREFRTSYLVDFIDRLFVVYEGRQSVLAETW